MELTKENYYEHTEYMSASQFKDFLKCPACAMAKIKDEWQPKKSKRLLLGSYVDETLTGDAESRTKFWDENREDIIQKNGKLYAEFEYANQVIERISKQPLMMKYLNGENQVIMTGKIEGVPVKIKMDSYKPHKFIADLKYMRSLRSPNLFTPMIKYWGYDLQAAIYQEIVYQNTGERLPFVFVIATKENQHIWLWLKYHSLIWMQHLTLLKPELRNLTM